MRHLGVDYGTKRVGLAVSDPLGTIAMPLRAEEVEGRKQAVAVVAAVCREVEAEMVVVGLPLNMDGSSGPMAQEAERFTRSLAARVEVAVVTWDERLSSSLVERMLVAADVSRRKRRGVRDKLAAQVILQGYLDAKAQAIEGEGLG